jgi:hypothetical protein
LGTICNLWWRGTTDWSEWSRPLSRVLVLLTTLLLLAMPITEHMCNWDKFLRGGPDVEFSLLAGLLFAAIVVLSMNGTMLQPGKLRPTRMRSGMVEVVPAATCAWRGPMSGTPARSGIAQSPASSGLGIRWLDGPASAFDSGKRSRAAVPMRV